MKQKKLVKKVYKACVEHDQAALVSLRKEEFAKIIKHKEEGKSFGVKWILVRIQVLELLCPNCHSQMDTYRNKRGKGEVSRVGLAAAALKAEGPERGV